METVAAAGVVTRKQTDIWLIGQRASSLSLTKLPSRKEVMSLFFHYKEVARQNIRDASHSTSVDVLRVWERASIPTRLKKHVVDKIESMFREWEKLKKNKENKAKRSERLKRNEDEWKDGLDNLFDIAHANALEMITIPEDKAFLLFQREKGRPGLIGNVDNELAKREADFQNRQEAFQRRSRREEEEIRSRAETVILASSTSSENEDDAEDEVDQAQPLQRSPLLSNPSTSVSRPQKRGRLNILDDKLAVSLDMAKVSDRGAALVLTPAIQHLGHDPSKYNVNYSSIRRERIKRRKKIAESLKKDFKPEIPLTIHWDGKLLEDITGKETVDRLPILVSGKGVDQLLGVPKLPSGTGEGAASAVHEAIVTWDLHDRVKCLCFDTTAVNTGPRNGACILLEQKLEKDMFWLACRHHILEIVWEAVVFVSLGPSKWPDILIFKRFQQNWPFINHTNYQTGISDHLVASAVVNIADEIIVFAQDQLQKFQPRDDYRELLQLTVTFLGGVPSTKFSFKAPSGLHRARWMAKAIYSLKIWMFKSQFKLTKKEEKGIRDICIFVVKLYIRVWFTAASATSAPRSDLKLLKDIDNYKTENVVISQIALKKFLGHLWYLSEELVAFALFDDEVSIETKRKIALALGTQTLGEELDLPPKRATVDPAMIQSKNLEDFVTSNTRRFFMITGLQSNFLDKDVDDWEEDEVYKSVKATSRSMQVVNDIAERGVALMEEYNKLHTNNEEQKQFLLLVVKQHRQKYPDRKKSTLMKDG